MKSKIVGFFLCITFILLNFSGCSSDLKYSKETFALDTIITLTAYGENADKVIDEAIVEINRLENLFSVTKDGSDVYKINSNAGNFTDVNPETVEIIKTAVEVARLTDGAFDPTVYPIVKAWGFTAEENRVPGEDEIKTLLQNVDYRKIEIENNAVRIPKNFAIDLGGIAKGYISDCLCRFFEEKNVKSALISLGGNVQSYNRKPDGSDYKIALCDPENTEKSVGYFLDSGNAIITSGDYQRFFESNEKKYHHIINPKTGYPADNGLTSVTVISKSGAYADALSTGLFVMGTQKATQLQKTVNDYEGIFITSDKKITSTSGIHDKFFVMESTDGYIYE